MSLRYVFKLVTYYKLFSSVFHTHKLRMVFHKLTKML